MTSASLLGSEIYCQPPVQLVGPEVLGLNNVLLNKFAAPRHGPELTYFKTNIIEMEVRHPFILEFGNVVSKV